MNVTIEVNGRRYGVEQEVALHLACLRSQITQLNKALDLAQVKDEPPPVIEILPPVVEQQRKRDRPFR